MQDVAREAGVTSITVSRFLRDPAMVADETARRIRDALTATGYVPNKQAGLLASGVSNMVAALLPNLANSIFAETAQGLSDGLQAAGFELLIASTGYSLEREEVQLRALLGWHPAALVITAGGIRRVPWPCWRTPRAAARRSSRSGTTTLPEGGPIGPGFTQIGFNHDEVGRAMAQHLLERLDTGRWPTSTAAWPKTTGHMSAGSHLRLRPEPAGAEVRVLVAPGR
jgi:LacI family gluconate utilization system Gnt-I transcriptional repressor